MKKIILSLAVLLVSTISAVSYAQAPASNDNKSSRIENAGKAKKDKKSAKENKGERKVDTMKAFEGLNLSAQQQQQLQDLQKNLRAEKAGEKKDKKEDLSEAQKKELKKANKAAKKERKQKYLNGVKSILTPDQYVIFLENFYVNQGGMDNKAPKMSKKFDGKKKIDRLPNKKK